MLKISVHKHKYLTETNIKTLAQNRIFTILDFLLEDAEKIAIITKLNLSQIIDLRSDIYSKYAAPIQSGNDLLAKNETVRNFECTGITSLDSILDGGIPVGYITEICGLAGSGKSQLCMQVAVNHAKSSKTILYIDTKGDFSAVQVQKLLDTMGFSHKEIAIIMLKIKVVFIWNLEDLIDLMQAIKNNKLEIDNLSLIIIDSLPCLMFQHFGDNNKIGNTHLNTMVNLLRYICKEKQSSALCVNIQTRWIEYEVADREDEDNMGTESNYHEKWIRCLGKYWQHIPYLVINLEKKLDTQSEDSKSFECNVTIYKSNIPQISRNCTLKFGSKIS